MKLDNAITLGAKGAWIEAQVRLSPGSRTHWFIMLRDSNKKSFILADNDDNAISSDDINDLARLLKSLGLKEFTGFL
ncbi:MAG: hypothetical protein GYB33_02385 [Gammaproteobacteria bacterium]|uniref:hypothetical protein n=1 Tax=Pseudomaricurvus alcaniphilus TaxID=1166482 RepID=UPI00140B68D6|nr:hypothetical protein [Pseudomaricurvus alcaniphilus]MBR9909181.1 hypothetical protein [Gammaproteobacteria bacterium]NHN38184.1 hypothetical protein [Pseudomaricurvus alcaniphilus]